MSKSTKKYAIENSSGQWWTGSCWGVEQAREEYTQDNIPCEIDGLAIWINSWSEPLDVGYIRDEDADDYEARVYEVSK